MDERKAMMQEWADFVDLLSAGEKKQGLQQVA